MANSTTLKISLRQRACALLGASALAVTLALLLAFALSAPADAQSAGSTPANAAGQVELVGGDGLRMLSADGNGVELQLDVAHYVLSPREVDGQKFDELSVDGTEPDQAVKGAPQLPVRSVVIGIPQDAEVQISVSGLGEDLPQRVRLLPVPSAQVSRAPFDPQSVTYSGVKYIPNAEAYSRVQLEPAAAARVLKTGNLRSQRYATLQLYPFQYNAAQQRLHWNQQVHVSVRFVYPRGRSAASQGTSRDEGAYESILHGQLLNYDVARGWRAPRTTSAGPARPQSPATAGGNYRISTDQEGIYRLTYSTLISAGVPPGSDPRTFTIRKNGVEIPIYVHGESDGIFDPGDYVEFYAQGIDNQYTNVNVYWLSVSGSYGVRMATRGVTPIAAPALSSFHDHVHLEENHIYNPDHPLGNADHWYWDVVLLGLPPPGPLYVSSPAVYTATLPDASSVGTATLRTFITGDLGNPDNPAPHYQQVYLNGNLIIDDSWVGNDPRQAANTFPQAYLISGTNAISYSLLYTASIPYDAVLFNWFEVDYEHLYRARNNYLAFGTDVSGSVQLTVTNFSTNTLAVYDVTNPTNTVMIMGAAAISSGGSYALSFGESLSATARYVAVASGKVPLSIVRDSSQSDLRNMGNGADEIFITGDDLYTATAPLEALRQSQGLRTMRVRISDVYDEFSDGVFDPIAIQRFLSYTYSYWLTPTPEYVLLVGNGNLNYRNFQPNNIGGPDAQVIPPFMDAVDPYFNQTATDNHYVSFGTNDMPYMAIGRLPVRTVTETTTVINKILSYERTPAPGSWRRTVDFITDNYYKGPNIGYDPAGNFYFTAESIAAHIPVTYTKARVYFCTDPCPPNTGGDPWYITATENADPVTGLGNIRYAITTTLNFGALFANYVGHASPNQWADEAIFYNEGAPPAYPRPDPLFQLNNGPRTPIVLELTCYAGSFYRPGITPLAQSWLLGPGGGAIADWASTGLGVNTGHEQLAGFFYDGVFQQNMRRLGLAVNYSKSILVTSNQYLDLVDEFTLFGDPATLIQLPPPLLPRSFLPIIRR